jgi:hypothetical protein
MSEDKDSDMNKTRQPKSGNPGTPERKQNQNKNKIKIWEQATNLFLEEVLCASYRDREIWRKGMERSKRAASKARKAEEEQGWRAQM